MLLNSAWLAETGMEIQSTVVTSESIFFFVIQADFALTDVSPRTDSKKNSVCDVVDSTVKRLWTVQTCDKDAEGWGPNQQKGSLATQNFMGLLIDVVVRRAKYYGVFSLT